MKKNSVLEHLSNLFDKNKIDLDPFPHIYMENVFPKKYYEEIQSNVPKKEKYIAINKTGRVDKNYSPDRYIFDLLVEDNVNQLENINQIFWKELIEILTSKILFNKVLNTFKEIIKDRINNFSILEKNQLGNEPFNFSLKTSLIKDFTNYSLGVHTDNVEKLITFLFYIPKDNKLSDFGTSLYKSKNREHMENDKHLSEEETSLYFEKIKTCNFLPNSLLVFPRTNISYHGVEKINIYKKERNLLLLNYYISKKDK